ncbi:MAG: hypothetical protein QOH57_3747 [Mycobacterium sp.]|nr:hypothetical protein [Mycobacterium sp.]
MWIGDRALVDPLTRMTTLVHDLGKRTRARRLRLRLLGVKGSQVQILSSRRRSEAISHRRDGLFHILGTTIGRSVAPVTLLDRWSMWPGNSSSGRLAGSHGAQTGSQEYGRTPRYRAPGARLCRSTGSCSHDSNETLSPRSPGSCVGPSRWTFRRRTVLVFRRVGRPVEVRVEQDGAVSACAGRGDRWVVAACQGLLKRGVCGDQRPHAARHLQSAPALGRSAVLATLRLE